MIDGKVIGIIIEYVIVFLIMIIFNYFVFVRKKKKLDKKKRIEIRKLRKFKLEPKFVNLFLKLLEYLSEV